MGFTVDDISGLAALVSLFSIAIANGALMQRDGRVLLGFFHN